MPQNYLLQHLTGAWSGPSKLWLTPSENARESNSTVQVSLFAQDQFIQFAYSWEYENKPQDGLVIVGTGGPNAAKKSVWFDSWHMRNSVMLCDTKEEQNGVVSMLGSYPAPPGPDWGWRIEIEVQSANSFVLRMFNITPDGEEALAVQSEYQRA